METIVIDAKLRNQSVKLNHLRAGSRIPAVYYGKNVDNVNLDLDYQAFRRVFATGGMNTVIDLNIDGKTFKTLVHDYQLDPVTDEFTHIDFIAVDLNKEVSTVVPLVFIGTAPAVKDLAGTLIENKIEVNITCLAKDLIHEIEVNIESLIDFNSVIHISDLQVPPTITIDDNAELTIASVVAPKSEEELEAEAAAADEAIAVAKEVAADEEDSEEGDKK